MSNCSQFPKGILGEWQKVLLGRRICFELKYGHGGAIVLTEFRVFIWRENDMA